MTSELPDPRPAPLDIAEAVEEIMRRLYGQGVYIGGSLNWAAGRHEIRVLVSNRPRCSGSGYSNNAPGRGPSTNHTLYVAPDWQEAVWENGIAVFQDRLILGAKPLPDTWRVYPERMLWRLIAAAGPEPIGTIHPRRGLIARFPQGYFGQASRSELELVKRLEVEQEQMRKKLSDWALSHHLAVAQAAPAFAHSFEVSQDVDPLPCLIACDHLEEIGQLELAELIRSTCPIST